MNNHRKSVNQQHHSPSWYEWRHHFHTHRIQFNRMIENEIQQRNRYPTFDLSLRIRNVDLYHCNRCIDSKEDNDDSDSSESNDSSNNNEDSIGDMNITLMKLQFENEFEHLSNYKTPNEIILIIDNWSKIKKICFEQWLAEYVENIENDDTNNEIYDQNNSTGGIELISIIF